MRLFISYSSRDRDAADFLADALQERGATVFIDYERLKVGKSFSDQLRDEILACDVLLLIISPRSVASEWVQAEVNWARHNDKLIVPVELEKTPEYKTVFWNLIHIERLDFTRWNTDRQMDEALKKLERSLGFVSSEDIPDVPSAAVDLAPVPPITAAPLTSSDANIGKVVGREQTADTQNGGGKSRRNRFEIIGLVLAALGVLVAVLAIPSEQWQNWGHTFGLVAASPTHTPSPTETSIPTATERPTPTDTPTIIPTTLDGDVFQDGQFGVVFADFTRIDSGVPNIEPNIISEFREADIPLVHVLYTLNDNEHACEVGSVYRASLVLWGEAALGGVRIFFEVLPCPLNGAGGDGGSVNVNEDQLFKDGEPQRFSTYIFEGMDTLYLAHFVKGQKAFFANDLSGALTAFQAAADLIPEGRENDVRAGTLYIYLGLVNDASGNYEQSIESYTRAIEFEPDNALAYYNRGNSYARQAMTLLQQATSQSDADQAFDLFQSAIDDYDRAIDLEYIDLYQAYTNRGNVYYSRQAYADAVESYTLAIADNREYAPAYLNRAIVRTLLGNSAGARDDFEDAVRNQPGTSDAIVALGLPRTASMTLGRAYRFTFDGRIGQMLDAQAIALDTNVDPLLVLLGPDGDALAVNDDSDNSFNAHIHLDELPENGRYTLLLTHSTGGTEGEIELTVRLEDPVEATAETID